MKRRANVNDTVRLIVPNARALTLLPPGTTLRVEAHIAEAQHELLAVVTAVPAEPSTYHIVVPKGAKVEVHEE